MTQSEQAYLPFYRYNPWHDDDEIISLQADTILPAACFFPKEGIPQRGPDRYFDYRFDLMLEAESALRDVLGLLVDFRQSRKLAHFLLSFCDHLEFTYDKDTGILRACCFRINFSDGVSIQYSSRVCGCILLLDGKQNSFHSISPQAIDDLRRLLAEIWDTIRNIPVWETVYESDQQITVVRRATAI